MFTQNFRPGVIERIGLDYESVKKSIQKLFTAVLVVMEIRGLGKICPDRIY